MADLLFIFIWLGVILLVVTVIGHGLWVFAATVFRQLVPPSDASRSAGVRCEQCGQTGHLENGVCRWCGHETHAMRARSLRYVLGQIRQLQKNGNGDPAVLEHAVQTIVRLQQDLHAVAGESTQTRASQKPAPNAATRSASTPTAHDAEEVMFLDDQALLPAELPQASAPVASVATQPDAVAQPAAASSDEEIVPIYAEIVEEDRPARKLHPLDQDEPEPATPVGGGQATFSPRHTLADMLQSFMEERNIRWGELASGMLIVGSAIGLIISLRATLAEWSERIYYLPALMFMLCTVTIHGAGLYTLRRWKLRSTSRGVLIIATLLVPLSFAAGIVLSGSASAEVPVWSPWYLGAIAIGLAGYGVVTAFSARALFLDGWWRLVIAVMGSAVGQLVINRLGPAPSTRTSVLLASAIFAIPLCAYLVATLTQLRAVARKQRLSPARAVQTFTVLGIATFSLLVALSLMVHVGGAIRDTLTVLSPCLSVAAAVVMGTGIAVQRRCDAARSAENRTAGTALAIFGGMLMLGALVLAWPAPVLLVTVSLVMTLAFASLAYVVRLPIFHAMSLVAATFALLLAFLKFSLPLPSDVELTGQMLIEALTVGRSAWALTAAATLVIGAAAWLRRREWTELAETYGWTSAGFAGVAACIALYAGFWTGSDADAMTPLYATYAVAALTVNWRMLRPWLSWLSAAAALVTAMHLLLCNETALAWLSRWNMTPRVPLWTALLAQGLITSSVSLAIWWLRRPTKHPLSGPHPEPAVSAGLIAPLTDAGAAAAGLAMLSLANWQVDLLGSHAVFAALIAVTWGVSALVTWRSTVFAAAYAAATVAITLGVAFLAADRPWPTPTLLDLRHGQWQVIGLGLWCGLSVAVLRFTRRSPGWREFWRDITPLTERVLPSALIAALFAIGIIGCLPGVLVELGFVGPQSKMATSIWHSQAMHFESWIALAVVALPLLAILIRQFTPWGVLALTAVTAMVPLLLAGRHEPEIAVASACRWGFALYGLVWAALLIGRRKVELVWQSWQSSTTAAVPDRCRELGPLTVTFAAFVVAALTFLAVGQSIQGNPLHGPLETSIFAAMVPLASYSIPLLLTLAAMLIVAVRDGNRAMAALGSLNTAFLTAILVNFAYRGNSAEQAFDWGVAMLQWQSIALGTYGLIWLTLGIWIDRQAPQGPHLFRTGLLAVPGAGVMWLALWAFSILFQEPAATAVEFGQLGGAATYLALAVALAAIAWHLAQQPRQLVWLGWVLPVLVAPLAAATVTRLGTSTDPWLGYHTLTGIWFGWGLTGALWLTWRTWQGAPSDWSNPNRWVAALMPLAVLVLLFRGFDGDPSSPNWTIGFLSGICAHWIVMGLTVRSQWYAHSSIGAALLAVGVYWIEIGGRFVNHPVLDGIFLIVITISIMAFFWLMVELWYQQQRQCSFDARAFRPRVHSLATGLALLLMGLFVFAATAISTAVQLSRTASVLQVADIWSGVALFCLGAVLCATLWDRHSRLAVPGWYLWGILGLALGINQIEQNYGKGGELSVLVACLGGAAYIALTGHLWRWGANLAQYAKRINIPDPIEKLAATSRWLPIVNILGSLLICALGFVMVFVAEERSMRMGVAFAPLLLAYGIACLASQRRDLRGEEREQRSSLQTLALLIAGLAAVYIGWADVRVLSDAAVGLAYAGRLLVCLAGVTLLYAVVAPRWLATANPWQEPVRRASLATAVATVVTLVVVLGLEVFHFVPGVGAPLATPEVIAISVMLGGFVVALFSMALWPGKDPLNLSEKGRSGYVYAAQCITAVLCAHVFLADPQIFLGSGFVRRNWPFLVMLLAFGSVAFGEFCARKNWRVISEPFLRTGGFLPLLPALAAWSFSQTNYPLVLFFAGLIYLFMAFARRSFVSGIAAGVMGNGALWALLSDKGFVLTAQPQFWLIPPALSVLIAAHVNRNRLSSAALTSIRYVCVMIIYLSSAGEMFMQLVVPSGPEDWLRPIILASLAIAGIFAGIVLRVRAFLYLGSSFLLLSIVAMVWNAGRIVQHTWPWWVFGIGVGLSILVLFGVFEKHRRDVQNLIARLRQWDA